MRSIITAAAWLLILTPGGVFAQQTLSGIVTDGTVGIEFANIDVMDQGGNGVPLSDDLTGPDGSFSTIISPSVASGLYDVIFKPPPGEPYFPVVMENVFVPAVGDVALGVIALPAGQFVSGRVISETSVGLPEVDLNFFDQSGVEFPASGDITDALGFFDVLVPPDIYDIEIRPTLTTPGGPYVPILLEAQLVNANLDLGDLVLRDGYSLFGVVQDQGGLPIANADIDVIDPVTGAKISTPGDNTDLSGAFDVLVPTGDWVIEVDPPVGVLVVPQLIPFTVVAAANNMGVIVLPPGVSVSGTTVDGGGSVVPEVDLDFVITATQVEIPTAHDNADDTGNFFVIVEPDTYDIQFRPPFATGLAPVVLEGQMVATALDLGPVVLPDGFALTGTVTANGQPLADVLVTLTDSNSGDPVYVFGNDTDALGQYGVNQVLGVYDVLFTPPPGSGLSPSLETDVALTQDVVLNVTLGSGPQAPPPVGSLVCSVTGSTVDLSWVNGASDYDSIEVLRNGATVTTLAGGVTSFSDLSVPDGMYTYDVVAIRDGLSSSATGCTVTVDNTPGDSDFIRGDANFDGTFNGLVDGLFILNFQFIPGSPVPPCPDSADADDNGIINGLVDGLFVLSAQFVPGSPLPSAPFPSAGQDPTPDGLDCP